MSNYHFKPLLQQTRAKTPAGAGPTPDAVAYLYYKCSHFACGHIVQGVVRGMTVERLKEIVFAPDFAPNPVCAACGRVTTGPIVNASAEGPDV